MLSAKSFVRILCVTAAIAIWTGCVSGPSKETPPAKVTRYAMVTGIKPEMIDRYKALHAKAWPDVLKTIKACNIRNYSIYLREIEGKSYLFGYFEYIGDDFEADMRKMAADSTTRRWWRETDPTQLPLPEAARAGEIWTPMEEVFHTP